MIILKLKPTTSKYNNNTNNKELSPESNHHSTPVRRSKGASPVLRTPKRVSNSSSQTEARLQTKPAFTIIEVVLVLAIAGLIFLMVFIALPALQRNQRDTQRKNDLNQLKTAIDNYKSNNKGSIPSAATLGGNTSTALVNSDFGQSYLAPYSSDTFKDPDGNNYIARAAVGRSAGFNPTDYGVTISSHYVYISLGAKCSGESLVITNASNNYAIQYALEGGGTYCIDG